MIWKIVLPALYVCLVLLSAFYSSSEIAFAKSNIKRMKNAAEAGDRKAERVVYISDHYTQSLSTILVGNNLVNIAASSVATMFFVVVMDMKTNGETWATVVTTLVLLIFGETLPKILAADRPDALAKVYAAPLRFCMRLFKPVVSMVSAMVSKLEHLWKPKEKVPQTTTEELCIILEDAEEQGVFTEEEGELIKSAIEITDIMAMEIITPRVDMVALDIDDIGEELPTEVLRHSRIPVYRGTIDNIIGVLPLKKLLKERLAQPGVKIDIESLLVPPIYVHKTRMVSSIIREFRRNHLQMAVVLDEFGGTMGILTMEDIMEEIVGEIFDERDDVEDDVVRTGDGMYLVDGSMNVYDMFEAIEYEPPKDFKTEYTTVGGWATEMLDKFPVQGDEFSYDRLTVRVLEVSSRRVGMVRVILSPEEETNE